MAKYSTGDSGGGGDGDSCELCGTASSRLSKANVEGAMLLVCPDCAPHDDTTKPSRSGSGSNQSNQRSQAETSSSDGPDNRKKRAAQRQAEMYDAATGDSTHWEEEGTNYEGDRLPYLVADYGDRAKSAREAADRSVDTVAEKLDIDASDIEAVEDGRATQASVGGSVVRALEDEFDIDLVDE